MRLTKRLRFLSQVLVFAGATLFYLPTWSQIMSTDEANSTYLDSPLDFLLKSSSSKIVRAVKLVLVSSDEAFRIRLNEDRLKKVGCTFSTGDSRHIVDLINILKNSDIKIAKNAGRDWEVEPREGIFLTLDSGLEVKFLFGKSMMYQDTVRGAFFSGPDEKKQLITGSILLPEQLLRWGVTVGIPKNENSQMEPECERFLKNSIAK